MSDYPQMIAAIDLVEPVPRRIRAMLAGKVILDTTRALYVWEWPNYPQYYIPIADVNAEVLVDEQHPSQLKRGSAQRYGLRVGDVSRPRRCARGYTESTVDGLAGTVRFEWAALDSWFEEDEEVFVHPRNPYTRVDALRSTRHVRIELDGVVLAESSSPVMVFETGLPTRYYLNRTEVNFAHLVADRHRHVVSVQGNDERLLVGARRRRAAPRPRVGLRLPDPPAAADRRTDRLLQREGRRRRRRRAPPSAEDALLQMTRAFRAPKPPAQSDTKGR